MTSSVQSGNAPRVDWRPYFPGLTSYVAGDSEEDDGQDEDTLGVRMRDGLPKMVGDTFFFGQSDYRTASVPPIVKLVHGTLRSRRRKTLKQTLEVVARGLGLN